MSRLMMTGDYTIRETSYRSDFKIEYYLSGKSYIHKNFKFVTKYGIAFGYKMYPLDLLFTSEYSINLDILHQAIYRNVSVKIYGSKTLNVE